MNSPFEGSPYPSCSEVWEQAGLWLRESIPKVAKGANQRWHVLQRYLLLVGIKPLKRDLQQAPAQKRPALCDEAAAVRRAQHEAIQLRLGEVALAYDKRKEFVEKVGVAHTMLTEPLLLLAGDPFVAVEHPSDGREQHSEDDFGLRLPIRGHMRQQLANGSFDVILFDAPKHDVSLIPGQDALGGGELFVKPRLEDPQRLQPDQINRIDLETSAALELRHMETEGAKETIDVAQVLEIFGDAIDIEVAPAVLVEQGFDCVLINEPVQASEKNFLDCPPVGVGNMKLNLDYFLKKLVPPVTGDSIQCLF